MTTKQFIASTSRWLQQWLSDTPKSERTMFEDWKKVYQTLRHDV